MSGYTPPGWPSEVHPPGSERFESTAVPWLLDLVPADYRLHGVLRRYPVVLARMARQHIEASIQAARRGYAEARLEFRDVVPPHGIDAVLDMYQKRGRQLVEAARAAELVEEALRGRRFVKKLLGNYPPSRRERGAEAGSRTSQRDRIVVARTAGYVMYRLMARFLPEVTGDLTLGDGTRCPRRDEFEE